MVDERSGQLITQELVDWADWIFLMDEKDDAHLSRLRLLFKSEGKNIVVLEISDVYGRSDEILIGILKHKLSLLGIEV